MTLKMLITFNTLTQMCKIVFEVKKGVTNCDDCPFWSRLYYCGQISSKSLCEQYDFSTLNLMKYNECICC